ncbi:MAG: 16S rRNA (guanine(527)-N(7))-methyltransferase RsmG [Sphingomonas sp.]|jgi:16S rRNA (guanine527-N7)-methyltransferase|uniref:16S rRNA (guanine(527)-N(7))-methyltransferase RsmG n=1 Tax=Sphingomonas sp. TaxID=28214 RepID=UPI003566FDC7
MTEAEAKAWIASRFGDAGKAAMAQFAAIVVEENARQNLIAPSTVESIWTRHIVDSAQLIGLAVGAPPGDWIDIGSGAGFPGLVIAALTDRSVWLVEPRKRRAEFLVEVAKALEIADRTHVICDRIEKIARPAALISARAVGPLTELFGWARDCTTPDTRWILPKGRSAREEVAIAEQGWHGVFHVEHSLTDPDSLIVLASGVSRR